MKKDINNNKSHNTIEQIKRQKYIEKWWRCLDMVDLFDKIKELEAKINEYEEDVWNMLWCVSIILFFSWIVIWLIIWYFIF